jgi:hypothetical protein
MVSSAGCNPVALCCGGSTPPVRTSWRSRHQGDVAKQDERLACNEEDVGSTPTVSTLAEGLILRPPPGLRSVNGKHAPFVRPRCGFDSCRRLSSNARMCGCSSGGRAPGRHPGDTRSIRVFRSSQARGVTASIASSNLVGSGFESWRACQFVVAGRSGSVIWLSSLRLSAVRVRARPHITTATSHHLLRAGTGPVIDSYSTGRGFESRPELFMLR